MKQPPKRIAGWYTDRPGFYRHWYGWANVYVLLRGQGQGVRVEIDYNETVSAW